VNNLVAAGIAYRVFSPGTEKTERGDIKNKKTEGDTGDRGNEGNGEHDARRLNIYK